MWRLRPDQTSPEPALAIRDLLFCFYIIGANDGAVGVLLPSLMGQYGVNKAQISLIF